MAESRDGRNDDVSSAAARYSIAIGQCYDVRDPYASLARAAGAEAAAFHRSQEALRAQMAAAEDPDKRQAIELRRRIEGCEYMAITSDRLAGIGLAVTGRLDSGEAVKNRQQAAHWRAQAAALREERGALREAIQAREAATRPQAANVTDLAQRRAGAAPPHRVAMPATAHPAQPDRTPDPRRPAEQETYRPIHPTLPRSNADEAARSPAAKPEQAAAPQPARPAASATPATDPAKRAAQPSPPAPPEAAPQPARIDPRPFQTVILKPSYAVTMSKPAAPVSRDTAARPVPAAPAAVPPIRAEAEVAPPAPAPEPERSALSERKADPEPARNEAPSPAKESIAVQPETPRSAPSPQPESHEQRPFGAVKLPAHPVAIAKTDEPKRAGTLSPDAPFGKPPAPATAPTRRFVEASAEDRATAQAAGITIRRVSTPTSERTNSQGVTRTVEITDGKAARDGAKSGAVRRVTGINPGKGQGLDNDRDGPSR